MNTNDKHGNSYERRAGRLYVTLTTGEERTIGDLRGDVLHVRRDRKDAHWFRNVGGWMMNRFVLAHRSAFGFTVCHFEGWRLKDSESGEWEWVMGYFHPDQPLSRSAQARHYKNKGFELQVPLLPDDLRPTLGSLHEAMRSWRAEREAPKSPPVVVVEPQMT